MISEASQTTDDEGRAGCTRMTLGDNATAQEEIVQARRDWMEGTRFGEVEGYDGAPLPPLHCVRYR